MKKIIKLALSTLFMLTLLTSGVFAETKTDSETGYRVYTHNKGFVDISPKSTHELEKMVISAIDEYKDGVRVLTATELWQSEDELNEYIKTMWLRSNKTGCISAYRNGNYPDVSFSFVYVETPEEEKQLQTFVDNWVKENITHKMSEIEKVNKIVKFIINEYSYFNEYEDPTSEKHFRRISVHSFLKNKTGLCSSYANMFERLATKSGVQNQLIFGAATNQDDLWHIWNLVFVNGKWYHLDITALDTENPKDLKSQKMLYSNHYLVDDERQSTEAKVVWNPDDYPLVSYEKFDNNYKHLKSIYGELTINFSTK